MDDGDTAVVRTMFSQGHGFASSEVNMIPLYHRGSNSVERRNNEYMHSPALVPG